MIVDTLRQHQKYHALHPLFESAFDALQEYLSCCPAVGRYPLLGEDLMAIVEEGGLTDKAQPKLEAHQRYIDIQFLLSGQQSLKWRPLSQCQKLTIGYNSARDICFYDDEPQAAMDLREGSFAIFFPDDAHLSCKGSSFKKIIMKVAVNVTSSSFPLEHSWNKKKP